MFNLRLCKEATIRYSLLKFGYMDLCGKGYKYFSPHCCKCNSFGCIAAIRCGNACHGPHSDSVYLGSEHRQFNSTRLVKREAGFPWPRRALIGPNQVWCVNDSPYYRELHETVHTKQLSKSTVSVVHCKYRQSSNITHTKSQNLNVSHLVLQLSLPNPLKSGVESGMKM